MVTRALLALALALSWASSAWADAKPFITGAQKSNYAAVDDDDCTSQQGQWWYDTVDARFEFCNANSGAPTLAGGSDGGNAATVTTVDAAADTTTFPLLASDATGSIAPYTDPGISYNASTNTLTVANIGGLAEADANGEAVRYEQLLATTAVALTGGDSTMVTATDWDFDSGSTVIFDSGSVIQLPHGASETTNAAGEIAFDSDYNGASRGSLQVYDGTANTYVVATTDLGTNGQVPVWVTGGTVEWQANTSAGVEDTAFASGWDGDTGNAPSQNAVYDMLSVRQMFWGASSMTVDGTQCAEPALATINSGPRIYTIICADNDGSTMYGHTVMPDGWDGGTVTFELEYLQTAADTNVLNADVAGECRGAGETVNNTWGTEIAIDDAAVSGSNIVDQTTSAAVTANGTCAAGDTLFWRIQLDATGTTTAVATLHFLGVKMTYTVATHD